jgi:hypothetical protein
MSTTSDLAASFSEAQTAVAQAAGMTGTKNTSYNGGTYVLTYGNPILQRVMLPSGGYRQRTAVPFSATRAQFSVPLVANKQLVRTDLTPHITYIIDGVNVHDPYHFTGFLVRVGEPPA